VISSYYPGGSYDFVEGSKQYDALELLAKSDPDLVPVPDGTSNYLLLQRYVLMLLYLYTSEGDNMWQDGKWLKEEAASFTCDWSGVVCSDGSYVDALRRTCSTVKTEPVIRHMISSLTAVLFSKQCKKKTFREPCLRKLDF
jgi:hypothetical protein